MGGLLCKGVVCGVFMYVGFARQVAVPRPGSRTLLEHPAPLLMCAASFFQGGALASSPPAASPKTCARTNLQDQTYQQTTCNAPTYTPPLWFHRPAVLQGRPAQIPTHHQRAAPAGPLHGHAQRVCGQNGMKAGGSRLWGLSRHRGSERRAGCHIYSGVSYRNCNNAYAMRVGCVSFVISS